MGRLFSLFPAEHYLSRIAPHPSLEVGKDINKSLGLREKIHRIPKDHGHAEKKMVPEVQAFAQAHKRGDTKKIK